MFLNYIEHSTQKNRKLITYSFDVKKESFAFLYVLVNFFKETYTAVAFTEEGRNQNKPVDLPTTQIL